MSGLLNLTSKQIRRVVASKLSLQNIVTTQETYGEFYLDGKYQFRVVMPNEHGGSGSISTGLLKQCRNSVHLNTQQYADLVRCPMTAEKYEQIIREKFGLTTSEESKNTAN